MTAVLRKVWSQVQPEVSPLASLFGERVIEDSIEMLSLNSISREGSARMLQQNSRQYGFLRGQSLSAAAADGGYNRLNGLKCDIASIDENSVFDFGPATIAATRDDDDYNWSLTNADENDPISLSILTRHRPVILIAHPVNSMQ
jgi:hypothetical protein